MLALDLKLDVPFVTFIASGYRGSNLDTNLSVSPGMRRTNVTTGSGTTAVTRLASIRSVQLEGAFAQALTKPWRVSFEATRYLTDTLPTGSAPSLGRTGNQFELGTLLALWARRAARAEDAPPGAPRSSDVTRGRPRHRPWTPVSASSRPRRVHR